MIGDWYQKYDATGEYESDENGDRHSSSIRISGKSKDTLEPLGLILGNGLGEQGPEACGKAGIEEIEISEEFKE